MWDADQVKQLAILWVFTISDGRNALLDFAERSGADFKLIRDVANTLTICGVFEQICTTRRSDAASTRCSNRRTPATERGLEMDQTAPFCVAETGLMAESLTPFRLDSWS
jgi:hypothetical protein